MTQKLLSFEACNPQANINRWYDVLIGIDLFGDWYVLTSWGRKGTKGRQKKEYVFPSSEEAFKKATSICKKRLSATKRIGCNYVCTSHPLTEENLQKKLKGSITEYDLKNFR